MARLTKTAHQHKPSAAKHGSHTKNLGPSRKAVAHPKGSQARGQKLKGRANGGLG